VNRTPMAGGNNNGVLPEGHSMKDLIQSDFRLVTPGYFATMRIPLKQGRTFSDGDVSGGAPVMVINEKLAKQAFPNLNPIGKHINCCDGIPKMVVGVVGDVRAHGLTSELTPEFYLPMQQAPGDSWRWIGRTMEIVLKTPAHPKLVANDLRQVVKRFDPTVPVYKLNAMEERVANTLEERRFTTTLLASFAAMALFLASIGIYGVVSYTVSQRTQEIGIRMALGAKRGQVLRLVVGYGLRLVLLGTVVGVAGAFAVSRFMSSLLFNIAPTDVTSFSLAAVTLLVLAMLASYVPAAKAMRIDPLVALRYD
jgi:putative ABC transport system permease protein